MGLVRLTAVRLERQDDVEQHEEREYEGLDEADEQLEPDERKHEARDEQQRGKNGEHDLAAPDVAPESERQRQDPEQLAEELDRPDEDEHHDADQWPLFERREVDPAGEVAEPVLLDPGPLIPDKAGEREAEVGVVVGCRRVQQLDLAHERHHRQPIAEQREQEERTEQRKEAHDGRAAGVLHEVNEALNDELDESLEASGHFADGARRDDPDRDEHDHDEPHREQRVGDRDVVPDRDHAATGRMILATQADEWRTRLLGDVDVGLARRPVRQVAGERRADDGDRVQEQHDADDLPHSLSSPDSFLCSRSWISRSQRLPASRAASLGGATGLRAMYRRMIRNIPRPATARPTRIDTRPRFGAVPNCSSSFCPTYAAASSGPPTTSAT